MRKFMCLAIAAGLASASIAAGQPGPGARRGVSALSSMQPGLWEFRSRGDASANRAICVTDPKAVLQLRHSGAACSRFVISDEPKATTVHYKCPAGGHGQTTVRVETPRLIQVETQGVDRREPFAFSAEGRRVGDCNAPR
jgi:hypothetical protein